MAGLTTNAEKTKMEANKRIDERLKKQEIESFPVMYLLISYKRL